VPAEVAPESLARIDRCWSLATSFGTDAGERRAARKSADRVVRATAIAERTCDGVVTFLRGTAAFLCGRWRAASELLDQGTTPCPGRQPRWHVTCFTSRHASLSSKRLAPAAAYITE
jgi:hypothetical protein